MNPERMQTQGFKDNYDYYASDMLAAANGTRAENLRPTCSGPVSTGVTLRALNDFSAWSTAGMIRILDATLRYPAFAERS